jgi:hypothetical protein
VTEGGSAFTFQNALPIIWVFCSPSIPSPALVPLLGNPTVAYVGPCIEGSFEWRHHPIFSMEPQQYQISLLQRKVLPLAAFSRVSLPPVLLLFHSPWKPEWSSRIQSEWHSHQKSSGACAASCTTFRHFSVKHTRSLPSGLCASLELHTAHHLVWQAELIPSHYAMIWPFWSFITGVPLADQCPCWLLNQKWKLI